MVKETENRKFVRFIFNQPFIFKLKNTEEWVEGFINDIGINGLNFSTTTPISKGDKIELKINYDKIFSKDIIFTATIKWVLKTKKQFQDFFISGIQFDNFNEEQGEYIQELIHECVKDEKNIKDIKSNKVYRILFVDDNQSLTKLFSCLAATHNFEGYTANNVESGLEIAEKLKPDIIITDINMKNISGYYFTAMLKTNNLTVPIPVIGCSITYPRSSDKFYLLGGNKFINDKPTSIEKLNLMLEGFLPNPLTNN